MLSKDADQSRHKRPRRRSRWTGLQGALRILIILCVVAITAIVLLIAHGYAGLSGPEQHATPTPVVSGSPTPVPTPALTPSPTPPSPTPSPAPSPPLSPTPEPTLPPGVLGFPLYSGNPRLPEIALTFDDGPNPPYTSQILAILQRYGVQATFFDIGSEAAAYPDLVQQETQQASIVGNHTWTHPPDLTSLPPKDVRAQLQSTSNEIEADTGMAPTLFRPPGGNYNGEVQSIAASLGLSTILWNVDPRDWSRPGTDKIIQNILDTTRNGSIIILHDGGGDRSETVAALPVIITALEQRGFRLVTIPQMIQHLPPGGTGQSSITPDQFTPEVLSASCEPTVIRTRLTVSLV
jgi:peptidoglycan-N-acetylglucosamine deacetylase